jgi:hypothetical protein
MDKVLDEDSSELTKEVRELTMAKRNSSYTNIRRFYKFQVG